MTDGVTLCHRAAADAMMSETQMLQRVSGQYRWSLLDIMHGPHYFCHTRIGSVILSLQFTLGLKGSAAIVTLARAPWHILK